MAAPERSVTREEAMVMFVRTFDVPVNSDVQLTFTDVANISSWAAQAVQGMKDNGYVGAKPDGSFGPGDYITRAEVATTLDKVHDSLYRVLTATAISAGGNHSMVVKEDGTLWTWGSNTYGQLGDGTQDDHYTPIKIMSEVSFVSVGWSHAIAVKKGNSLWAWGWNYFGQMGVDTDFGEDDVGILAPVRIMDDAATASAGYMHSMAVKSDGTLWTLGCNIFGQLGNGTVTGWTELGEYDNNNSPEPIKVK